MKSLILFLFIVVLAGTSLAQPANDNCSGAITLTVQSYCNPTPGNSTTATQSSVGCSGLADDDVWYSFIANTNAVKVMGYSGGNGFDPVLEAFSSCGSSMQCENAVTGTAAEEMNLSNLTINVRYWFRIYHAGGGGGPFSVCVMDAGGIPPCDPYAPEPANTMNPCPAVPTICNVDGFCGTTRGYHPTPGGPMTSYTPNSWSHINNAFCGSIENNSFIKFVASATSVGLRVYGSCSFGSGIQMMMFELQDSAVAGNCEGGPIATYGCFNHIQLNPPPPQGFPVSFTGLTPGSTYYLMVDGYAGSECDYQVGADYGVQLSISVNPKYREICLGNSIQISASGGDANYTWDNSPDLNTTSGPTVIATPTSTGIKEYVAHSPSANTSCPNSTDTSFITVVAPPEPNAGFNDSLCFGDTINLDATASGMNSLFWSWEVQGAPATPIVNWFPNGIVKSPTVNVDQPGIYKFILRETNQLCGVFHDTVEITVLRQEHYATALSPSCNDAEDGAIEIVDQTASEYSFDDGINWHLSNVTDTFPAGTYSVCSKNYLGCQVCSNVTINPGPEILLSVSEDTVVCENGTATLRAWVNSAIPVDYLWSHSSSRDPIQIIRPTLSGFYNVYADNGISCKTPPDSIYVHVLPPIELTTSLDTAVCPGETVSIEASASEGNGGPYVFTWSDGSVSGPQYVDDQLVRPDSTTSYTITVSDNCESTPISKEVEIIIYPLPEPNFFLTEDSLCEPANSEIHITTDKSTYAKTYWTLSNGLYFQNQDIVSLKEYPVGMYDVSLDMVSKEGCFNTKTIEDAFTVFTTPEAKFFVNPQQLTIQEVEASFKNASIGGTTYEWFLPGAYPDYAKTEDVTSVYPEGQVGIYDAELYVYTEHGCYDSAAMKIQVVPNVLAYISNSFTPNHDGHNNKWLYSFDGIDEGSFEVNVFNRWGELVFESGHLTDYWNGTYQGHIVPDGAYTYRISADNKFTGEHMEWLGSLIILK